MKKFKEWFANNLLNIIGLIPTLLGLGSMIWTFISNQRTILYLTITLIVIVVVQFIIVLSIIIWRKISYKSYFYPASKIKSDFTVDEKSIDYVRTENDDLLFSKTLKIVSNKDNLTEFEDKYIWTGTEKANIPIPENNVREILDESEKKGIWSFYKVIFEETLDKGETYTLKYKWQIIHKCSSSSAFVSMPTEEPTKKICFNLDLGAKYKNIQVIQEEYRSIDGIYLLSKKSYRTDDNGKIEIKIEHPKRFRYFIVRWNWGR